ncbi:YfiR family protein [Horticoccus sp. 23ND18S-11]|uniref:YfiR family protein n=1 Tax=Horticoccus sp. 23ND18S-11 TaxID=3391832 RepID=UPI0039C9F497
MSWFGTVRRCHGCLRLAGLLLAAWPGGISVHAASADAVVYEYNVKAGYLFNFARFVEWPATAFATPISPFVIGVLDAVEAPSPPRRSAERLALTWRPLHANGPPPSDRVR